MSEFVDEFRKCEKAVKKYFKGKTTFHFADELELFPCELIIPKIDDTQNYPNLPYGFHIIPGALSLSEQLYWATAAVEKYSLSVNNNLKNLCHLHSKDPKDLDTIWNDSVAEHNQLVKFRTLRWSTLGYHYDWTARSYKQDFHSEFPNDLAQLCQNLASKVGQSLLPEAGIVNYYPIGTTMSGHLDDAEHNMDEPIVSISIGCPCIFLIGGPVKSVAPIALLLRSGDVVVMGGQSRFCYHGVACVFAHDLLEEKERSSATLFTGGDSVCGVGSVVEYLRIGRININARRVRNVGEEWRDKNGTGYTSPAPADSISVTATCTDHGP